MLRVLPDMWCNKCWSKFLWDLLCSFRSFRVLFCVLFNFNILHLIHVFRIGVRFLCNLSTPFQFVHRWECMWISCWLDCTLASRLTVYRKTETRWDPHGRFSRLSSEIALCFDLIFSALQHHSPFICGSWLSPRFNLKQSWMWHKAHSDPMETQGVS